MKSDLEIQQDIEQELLWDPSVDARHIKVGVHQRIATLDGSVPSYAQKLAAQKAAQRVADCRAVVVDVVVRAPEPRPAHDEQLANAVLSALNWQDTLPRDAVHAVVDHGCVTLTGEVGYRAQREAAEAIVSRMRGVVGVANRITVRAHPGNGDVRAHIAAALARRAQDEAVAIHVDDRDGVIRLTGTVGSIAEKNEAAKAAWSTHGVKWVVNQLEVI